ncbi:MAG: ATP-binding cassette domain-containing protein [Bdellovibrionales bacterium]|nr:ATP-binding cassette domain-containing protein [Bdellovibrionales bacterium]
MSVQRKAIQSLKLDDITFAYEGHAPIFENISLELPKSRAVWIRSPGQRGKSTLLKILAGLLTPQMGRYLINGETVSEMSFEEFLPYRLSMGYGFDMGGLFNNKSMTENLTLPLLYHNLLSPSETNDRVNEVMQLFGLGSIKEHRPFAVSGSQRKLFCVIRPFIHWPQVVFLDDPVTGLKQDNLNDFFHFVDEGFASRGLKQMFFTGESPVLANRFQAEELMVSGDWFMTRSVA